MLAAACLPLLLRSLAGAPGGSGTTFPPLLINQAAPSLALTDLQGHTVSLEDYHGKLVLVNNWATWCPPCQAEMPDLQAYYQAHAAQGFVIVAIESGEPAGTVSDFVRQHGLTFPVWPDPQESATAAFQNWDLPSSYVVDQAGRLRMYWTGEINPATLEKYITPLLDGLPK